MADKILVVDDDPHIAEMLSLVLEDEGFETATVMDGSEAVVAARNEEPDLILLDIMLPGVNGVDICRIVREESDVPIIMLTAKTDTEDLVTALEAGADDYVYKPFKPQELLARIGARLRRTEPRNAEVIHLGEITIDSPRHQVTRGDEEIKLTPLEFALLETMATRPGEVFSREELTTLIWADHPNGPNNRTLTVHVQRLRAKVERDPDNPRVVLTVRGVGYKVAAN